MGSTISKKADMSLTNINNVCEKLECMNTLLTQIRNERPFYKYVYECNSIYVFLYTNMKLSYRQITARECTQVIQVLNERIEGLKYIVKYESENRMSEKEYTSRKICTQSCPPL